jgi:hypothetical protein
MSDVPWWFLVPVDEDGRDDVGVARPLNADPVRDLEQRHEMLDGKRVTDWREPEYRLEGGGFGDYPRESRGYRLCSDRLRTAIDAAKADADPLEWLPARVTDDEGETRSYWVLNLLRHPATKIAGLEDFDWQRLREANREGRLDAYTVMPGPGFGLVSFLVRDEARAVIVEAGCDVGWRSL